MTWMVAPPKRTRAFGGNFTSNVRDWQMGVTVMFCLSTCFFRICAAFFVKPVRVWSLGEMTRWKMRQVTDIRSYK